MPRGAQLEQRLLLRHRPRDERFGGRDVDHLMRVLGAGRQRNPVSRPHRDACIADPRLSGTQEDIDRFFVDVRPSHNRLRRSHVERGTRLKDGANCNPPSRPASTHSLAGRRTACVRTSTGIPRPIYRHRQRIPCRPFEICRPDRICMTRRRRRESRANSSRECGVPGNFKWGWGRFWPR